MPTRRPPVLFCVLDGWGLSNEVRGNAVRAAKTPNFDRLWQTGPRTTLDASGPAVGLRPGLMGNSEVGHTNLGAGRVVWQEITRIDRAIEDGSFFENDALLSAFRPALEGGAVHLVGLVSNGGVHSDEVHYLALLSLAARLEVPPDRLLFHVFTDGRDTSPTGGAGYVRKILATMDRARTGRIATVTGRYWAMDRDKRWDRTRRAYEAMVLARGRSAGDPVALLDACYAAGETDEFVEPTVLPAGRERPVRDGDGMVFFNFRADRMRQIARAFVGEDFDGFPREAWPRVRAVTMLPYEENLAAATVFVKDELVHTLGGWASEHGLAQLRIAETEKYAHVTYFFNGGREEPFAGEDRILVPSPRDVATYDARPEMSAPEVARRLVAEIEAARHDLVVLNFANPDMVGHTGVFDAAVRAVETADRCLGQVLAAMSARGGRGIVTADHGNAETMLQPDGSPHTAHTTNPVPCVLFGFPDATRLVEGGNLASIAPALCKLLGLAIPPEMTGRPLF